MQSRIAQLQNLLLTVPLILAFRSGWAEAASNEVGRLSFVTATTAEELGGVVDVAITTNGQFLYTAAYQASTISVYRRDSQSGQLSFVQCLRDLPGLNGAISLRLSPDERYAVSAAYRAEAVVLFQRDPESGRLDPVQVAGRREGFPGLDYAVRALFAPDGKHVYALSGSKNGGITTLAFAPDRGLVWSQGFTNLSTAGGSRALVMLPGGRTVIVVNHRSHSLAVLDRDPDSGRVALRQALLDGEEGADQIEGQFGVTASPDGKFVYVCSGRVSGDNAVSVFRVAPAGRLVPVQAFTDREEGLVFVGGNEVVVSPDARNVYATATRSGTLACFARDGLSGKLRLLQSFVNDKRTVKLDGPAGLACSPDGRFVYVATEWQKCIVSYRRELSP